MGGGGGVSGGWAAGWLSVVYIIDTLILGGIIRPSIV